jgi:hypothetical protein
MIKIVDPAPARGIPTNAWNTVLAADEAAASHDGL